jgi:hypothetical protein
MSNTDTTVPIERPANWLRCVAPCDIDKHDDLAATGVVFPDGIIVLHWCHDSSTVIYADDQASLEALKNARYVVHFTEVEVSLQ